MTNDGSFLFPLKGMGAKKGASVSTRILSKGTYLTTSIKSSTFLNVIIPEKNLKRLTLEANGMYSHEAIIYQVLNGKNGMPAFGGRLNQTEIDNVAEYVIISAESNFEN